MIVKFSRHAKRRAKLYKIPEATVRDIVNASPLGAGEHEVIKDISGFEFPIKIVVTVKENVIMVITNYPLKKGR